MLPEIEERYAEYRPPFDVTKVVQELLAPVPEKYTRGLKKVLLVDSGSLGRRDRVGKVWSRKRKFAKQAVRGMYHPDRNAPWIEIRVDRTTEAWKGMPRWLFWLPLIRYIVIAEIFYHELGHHIHYTVRPEFREREDVAEVWRRKLSSNFIRAKYPHLFSVVLATKAIYAKLRQTNN